MTSVLRVALCALAVLTSIPAFADDMAQKAINTPGDMWGTWGNAKSEVVPDTGVDGGKAKRVTISPKPQNAWDVGGYVLITKPVHKGDVILLAFWARAEKIPDNGDFIGTSARVHEVAPPSASVTPETQFLIGKDWKIFYASGVADKDYPVGTLGCGMILGTGDQVIDFGPAYIVDYGPGYDLAKLPQN
jgi:hypothetical protein